MGGRPQETTAPKHSPGRHRCMTLEGRVDEKTLYRLSDATEVAGKGKSIEMTRANSVGRLIFKIFKNQHNNCKNTPLEK